MMKCYTEKKLELIHFRVSFIIKSWGKISHKRLIMCWHWKKNESQPVPPTEQKNSPAL